MEILCHLHVDCQKLKVELFCEINPEIKMLVKLL